MPFDWSKYRDGERFKFVKHGDKVEGEIVRISTTTFGGTSDPTPQLEIRTDQGRVLSVTASNVALCNRLAEEGPDEGDTISITYTGDGDAKPGKNAPKLFDVIVKRKGEAAAATAQAPADTEDEPF